MEFVLSMLNQTAFFPVVVSVLVAGLAGRATSIQCVGCIAVAAGFFAGWASQDWTTLQPKRYLDWLPYGAVLLAVVIVVLNRVTEKYQWVGVSAAIVVVACFLVPSFPRLQPSRPIAIFLVAVSGGVLAEVSRRLESRIPARLMIVAFMAIGTSTALVMAQSFGLKFAQISGMLTAALAGSLVFANPRLLAGVAAVFLPLLCNVLFMGYASSSSDVPWYSFALLPFAVLAFWIVPDNPETPKRRLVITAGVVFAAILLTGVVPALLAHPPWEADLAAVSEFPGGDHLMLTGQKSTPSQFH